MYKNTVIIHADCEDKLQQLSYDINCTNRDQFYDLLLDYVPLKIREIIPIDQGYSVAWTDKFQYEQFIDDDRYKRIILFLKDYKIRIGWV